MTLKNNQAVVGIQKLVWKTFNIISGIRQENKISSIIFNFYFGLSPIVRLHRGGLALNRPAVRFGFAEDSSVNSNLGDLNGILCTIENIPET